MSVSERRRMRGDRQGDRREREDREGRDQLGENEWERERKAERLIGRERKRERRGHFRLCLGFLRWAVCTITTVRHM